MKLQPLPLACGIAKMIGATVGTDGLSNLLPLNLREPLAVTQGMVVVRCDTVEILHGELGKELKLKHSSVLELHNSTRINLRLSLPRQACAHDPALPWSMRDNDLSEWTLHTWCASSC
jgi:hypothetical protein